MIEVFEDYYITEATADTVADQQEYTLPTDFLKIRRVEINYDIDSSNSSFMRALPIAIDEVKTNLGNINLGVSIGSRPGYFLQGGIISFFHSLRKMGTKQLRFGISNIRQTL